MALYIGSSCPVCNEKFKQGDDIVVCPDCGTPYHRICWNKTGVCLHEAEHAAGFEWKSEQTAEAVEAICRNCGTHNPAGAQRCRHCGVPLDLPEKEEPTPIYSQPRAAGQQTGDGREPHFQAYTASNGTMYRRDIGPDDDIDGIKARDWASYIGKSSLYYLMQFFRMSTTKRKTSVSFSAFVFGPAYFFYRKMWKQAALFAAADLLLSVPSLIYMLAVSQAPILSGVSLDWLPLASEICYVGSWIVKFAMGMFATYWYKQEATRQIQSVYDSFPEGTDRSDALALRGGTSVSAVVCYFIAYTLLGVLLTFLVGPDLNSLASVMF